VSASSRTAHAELGVATLQVLLDRAAADRETFRDPPVRSRQARGPLPRVPLGGIARSEPLIVGPSPRH
jgi:hypothetical protein